MRSYLTIDLARGTTTRETLQGDDIVRAGRHFIARTLMARRAYEIDPLSPANPLIFSAGPLAETVVRPDPSRLIR